jgi:hypothetical protein
MTPPVPTNDPFAFLGHDGSAAQLVRDFAWGTTPLGWVET